MPEKPKRRVVKQAETPPRAKLKKSRRLKSPSMPKPARQRREFHLPLPDNKFGRLLNRRVRLAPSYFGESWRELRQVTWPNNKDTLRLSLAVFIFAVVFGGLIWLVDYGLDRLFREILLN